MEDVIFSIGLSIMTGVLISVLILSRYAEESAEDVSSKEAVIGSQAEQVSNEYYNVFVTENEEEVSEFFHDEDHRIINVANDSGKYYILYSISE